MPPPQIFSLDGHAFGLTVSGVQLIDYVPTDVAPIRWDMPSASGNGGISFTILDEGEHAIPPGAVVRLTDNVNNEALFTGVLVNRRFARHGGPYRTVECDGVGWGYYLDKRLVTSFEWAASTAVLEAAAVRRVIREFGGPVEAAAYFPGGGYTADTAGTATKTSVRSVISTLDTYFSESNDHSLYVDNAQQLHYFVTPGMESNVVGTAAYSIGSGGTFTPESLTYEVGSDSTFGISAAYGTAGNFLRWTRSSSPGPAWEAGDTSTSWDAVEMDDYSAVGQAANQLRNFYSDITSISFSTVEYGGWKPHMALVVEDSMLTGGAAETHYIASVSGTIDDRNLIEWRVTTGAVARSIVQTVATP